MLGTEPELVANEVTNGDAQIIFWPVINHGNPSVYASVSMECAGQQSLESAWDMHKALFEDISILYTAGLDHYINLANQIGIDADKFVTCYGDQATVDHIMSLDAIRRDRGITGQPIFDINGEGVLLGPQPYIVFQDAIAYVIELQEQ